MLDDCVSSASGMGAPLAGAENWRHRADSIFLSRNQIAELAEGRRDNDIVPLSQPPIDESRETDSPASPPQPGLMAVAVGTCVGMSTGIGIATGLVLAMPKTQLDVAAILHQALTLFA